MNANLGATDPIDPAVNPAYHATAPRVLATAPNPSTLPVQQHAPFQSPMLYQVPTSPTACMLTGETVFDERNYQPGAVEE